MIMMYLLGVFLLALSILLDEGSTLIAVLRGLGPLETNIIYTRYGIAATIAIITLSYVLLIYFWGWMIKMQRLAWAANSKYKHFFDVSVFMICFLLMFITVNKVHTAYSNTQLILESMNPETQDQVYRSVETIKELKISNNTEYIRASTEVYLTGSYNGISYGLMVFIVLCSFILFKIGNKVVPWAYA